MNREDDIHQDENGRWRIGNLVVGPVSESHLRAALLPTKPSEDARHILGKIDLPEGESWGVERDYLPEPAVSWIVDIRFEGDHSLTPKAVSDIFDKKWRSDYGGLVAYGRDIDTGKWTYLISADGPKAVDRLKLKFNYISWSDEKLLFDGERLFAERLKEIELRLNRIGKASISASLSPLEAAQRSQLLDEIRERLDTTAVLVLEAPRGKPFDGKHVWDVMLCLGLAWGDMDCFHWHSQSSFGDDYLFSVETSTPPGYFLPEEVAADRVRVDDLIFAYSVPRSAKPVEVFEAMFRAVEYSRSRLGGTVVDTEGSPANIAVQRQQVLDVSEELRDSGFEPGSSAALQLF